MFWKKKEEVTDTDKSLDGEGIQDALNEANRRAERQLDIIKEKRLARDVKKAEDFIKKKLQERYSDESHHLFPELYEDED